MGTIISTSTTSGITLSSTTGNPVSVTSTGHINASSGYGIYIKASAGGTWTITNSGTIKAAANHGVDLGHQRSPAINGVITNNSGAYIGGFGASRYGVAVFGNATLVNNGTIKGQAGGVGIQGAGTVTNSGLIQGSAGGGGAGVYIYNGLVTNNAGATISGQYGVVVNTNTASTITNFGTIIGLSSGSSGGAVRFKGTNTADRLIEEPGAALTGGGIYGGTGVLELASATSAQTLSPVHISNFSTILFDSAHWLVGAKYADIHSSTISGFVGGDTIDLTNFRATGSSFSSGVLTLTNGATSTSLTFQGSFTQSEFTITSDGVSGTDIVVCFLAGTRIATPRGPLPIEQLAVGDVVVSHFGGPVPIRFIGRRTVDCTRHPDPGLVWPVRITPHAFGANRPSRELLLSPNHAVYVDEALIPIHHLINGRTIAQVRRNCVTYYHLELAEHDLLLAEGLLAESYLDVGDRDIFDNGGAVTRLFPDLRQTRVPDRWESLGCAPLVVHGKLLDAVRTRLTGLSNGNADRKSYGRSLGG